MRDNPLLATVPGRTLSAAAQQLRFSASPVTDCLATAKGLQGRKECVAPGAQSCGTRGGGRAFCCTAKTQWWISRMGLVPDPSQVKDQIRDGKVAPAMPGGFRQMQDLAAMLRRRALLSLVMAACGVTRLTGALALFLETSAHYRTKQEEQPAPSHCWRCWAVQPRRRQLTSTPTRCAPVSPAPTASHPPASARPPMPVSPSPAATRPLAPPTVSWPRPGSGMTC